LFCARAGGHRLRDAGEFGSRLLDRDAGRKTPEDLQ
jgi:hypothetical protein